MIVVVQGSSLIDSRVANIDIDPQKLGLTARRKDPQLHAGSNVRDYKSEWPTSGASQKTKVRILGAPIGEFRTLPPIPPVPRLTPTMRHRKNHDLRRKILIHNAEGKLSEGIFSEILEIDGGQR
jgi:hypothetical protein